MDAILPADFMDARDWRMCAKRGGWMEWGDIIAVLLHRYLGGQIDRQIKVDHLNDTFCPSPLTELAWEVEAEGSG